MDKDHGNADLSKRIRALRKLASKRPYFVPVGELKTFLGMTRQNVLRLLSSSSNDEDRLLNEGYGNFPFRPVSLTTARQWVSRHAPQNEENFEEFVTRQRYDSVHYVSLTEASDALGIPVKSIRGRMNRDGKKDLGHLIGIRSSYTWLIPADKLRDLLVRVRIRPRYHFLPCDTLKKENRSRSLPPYGYSWMSELCIKYRVMRTTLKKFLATMEAEIGGLPVVKRKGNRQAILDVAAERAIKWIQTSRNYRQENKE